MSTIKLNGTTSGSSIIKAPDSGSTNQTFTLPASSGTLVTTTDAGVAGISSSADATAMTITSGEKVGFGTTTPQAAVTVKVQDTAVSAGVNFLAEAKGSAGSTGGYYFSSHDLASPRKKQAIVNKKNTGGSTGDYGVGSLLFLVDSNTDDADVSEADSKLEITSDGRGLSQFTAKSWCKYNDTTISDSHNISSMTDVETGVSIANYSNNMASTEYAAVASTHAHYCDMHGPYIMSTQTSSLKILSLLKTNCDYGDRTTYFVVFGD